MLALKRNDNGFALVNTSRARPQLLGAVPLALLATLPLLGPGELDIGRAGMALVLGAVSGVWLARSLPRRRVSRLERAAGKVSIAGVQHEPLAIALAGVREDSLNSAPSFRAELLTPSTRVRVLDGTDPAVVATQAEQIARFLGVPLQPGWGLDAEALSVPSANPLDERRPQTGPSDRRRRPPSPELRVVGKPEPSQRAAGFTALGSTIFILCFAAVLVSQRLEQGLPISMLSLVLSILIIGLGVFVSFWLLGVRSELRLSRDGLEYWRYWFKQPLGRTALPLSKIEAVYAVSPDGMEPTHVLTRVEGGWSSFSLTGEPARRMAASFQPISRQAERPAHWSERADSTEFSGARTASG